MALLFLLLATPDGHGFPKVLKHCKFFIHWKGAVFHSLILSSPDDLRDDFLRRLGIPFVLWSL